MKNSHLYLLMYKKNFVESLVHKNKHNNINQVNKCLNNYYDSKDYKNIENLLSWAKDKGGVFDKFQIKYLDLSNRFVTSRNFIKVLIIKMYLPNKL